MSQVIVTIAGRTYRMACEEGEQDHLTELARFVEDKILALRKGFGEIGEQRIVIMAAITIADEIVAGRKKVAALEAEVKALRANSEAKIREEAALEERVAKALDDTALRLERLAANLSRADPEPADIG
jgi:cell division protein ZapA